MTEVCIHPSDTARALPAHTPGPWLAASKPSSVAGWPVVGELGTLIADVCTMRFTGETPVPKEAEANARLIAAAPELLEALDKYADDLCEGWCEESPDCAHFDDCAGCLARRTAWKARGAA